MNLSIERASSPDSNQHKMSSLAQTFINLASDQILDQKGQGQGQNEGQPSKVNLSTEKATSPDSNQHKMSSLAQKKSST